MPRVRAAALLAVVALVAVGCLGQPATQQSPTPRADTFPVTLTDDDGVNVTLDKLPRRIVTFAPSNTEIVFALGLDEELVGVAGSFDNYPAEAKAVEHVAGPSGVDPNVEKVVSLHPDLLLAIAGGDQWKERLRDLHINVFTINATNFPDLLHDIQTVGRLTGRADQADTLTRDMERKAAAVKVQQRTPCFFEAFYPPLTTVGPNTFIFDILRRGGCDPASAGAKDDYPQWSVDQLVRDDPPVYLVASESGVSAAAVGRRPGFGSLSAVQRHRVILVNSDLISRPGPRVVQGLEAVARAVAG